MYLPRSRGPVGQILGCGARSGLQYDCVIDMPVGATLGGKGGVTGPAWTVAVSQTQTTKLKTALPTAKQLIPTMQTEACSTISIPSGAIYPVHCCCGHSMARMLLLLCVSSGILQPGVHPSAAQGL